MASHRFIKRLQSLIWVYIYGGLLAIVLVQWLVGSRKLGRRSGAQPAVAPVAVGG